MAQALQSIVVTGHIGNDIAMRYTPAGMAVLDINVGTGVSRGKREVVTNWYTATVWGAYAESLAGYLRKGMHVAVSGTPFQETYTNKEGVEKTRFKIENPVVKTLDKNDQSSSSEDSEETPWG